MFTELETERLLLKNIGYDDVEFMYKEFSTDEVNAYLYDAEPSSSLDDARELIDFYVQDEPRCQHRWILIAKDLHEKIGTCGFHRWNRRECSVEIGYDLQPDFWRKGYMHEALSEIISFAQREMNVKTITANIAERNVASMNTAARLGFYRTDKSYFEDFHGEKYLHYVYQLDL